MSMKRRAAKRVLTAICLATIALGLPAHAENAVNIYSYREPKLDRKSVV